MPWHVVKVRHPAQMSSVSWAKANLEYQAPLATCRLFGRQPGQQGDN